MRQRLQFLPSVFPSKKALIQIGKEKKENMYVCTSNIIEELKEEASLLQSLLRGPKCNSIKWLVSHKKVFLAPLQIYGCHTCKLLNSRQNMPPVRENFNCVL